MEFDRYDPGKIETKWLRIWEQNKTFKVDLDKAKKPFYNLMMFPYPSGEGLHVGHVYAFGGSDTFARFKKLQGFDVFEPMGFDSFGIHSENYAIKKGIHPKDLIADTTTYFREKQLKRLGMLFDWDHQVITSDPDYYKWTQWIFIQLFKAGLAERKKASVDWCPSCKTVLANEQVINGYCERCSSQVVQKELEQWFFKITEYTEKLLKNLETIDWSATTKLMQKNWIGRSVGTLIKFPVTGSQKSENKKSEDQNLEASHYIEVFTTRADTIFGATFMVIAPEHKLALKLSTAKYNEAVGLYIAESKKVSEITRSQAKTGVFTGAYCINPLTNEEIPIWVADYVLRGYGTGAIMAVPGHDQRDWEFAKEHDLKIVEVISGGDVRKEAYVGEGKLVNSGKFNGLGSIEGIKNISEYIESNKLGKKTVTYHLRDWLISRQRYWGPPIPMIYCGSCAERGKGEKVNGKVSQPGWYSVAEKDLPVELPFLKDYQPQGRGVSPLGSLPDFLSVKCSGCGEKARRETDVSDTFLDSSWYFLRYPSVGLPTSEQAPFDPNLTKKWLPVDMYIGGNEHAVMHLLYTRFITAALHDMNHIDFAEPFKKFRAHGLIIHEGAKMSKSRGNVVNPNEFMDSYGADALRMYLLFIGPYDLGGDFSDRAIAGMYRFLGRVWKFVGKTSKHKPSIASSQISRAINRLINKVEADLESLKFNTAIAAIMEFTNLASKNIKDVDDDILKKYLITLSVFAPFTTEELWERIGQKDSIHRQSWPKVQPKALEEQEVTIVVQVNGKLRATLRVDQSKIRDQKKVERQAQDLENVKKYVSGKKIKKVIYVPGKILNIVIDN